MRIVSLLPSTTEILFGLGAGDDVVGVTFECDYPAEARSRRIVSTSTMPEGLTPAQIDEFVSVAVERGDDMYRLAADALTELDADLVVTQDLCAVCAIDVSTVDDALAHLGCSADVATFDPHTIDEVFDSILTLGERCGRGAAADEWVASLRERLEAVGSAVAGRERPRVLVLEWTDPPYAPGHWIPEMVERAGGEPVLGRVSEKSVRITWADADATDPDIVIVAPCGYGLDGAAEQAVAVAERFEGIPVWAVDANASFARPGPRIVDGIEALAAIFHPGAAGRVMPTRARLVPPPAAGDPVIGLTRWTGPWPDDDRDANLKSDVALYSAADPLVTLRGLSAGTGIPVGALARYVLAKYATSGSGGLLEIGPVMVNRLSEPIERAEEVGTDEARLAAYDQLRQMISWLRFPLDHPEVYGGDQKPAGSSTDG